MYRGLFMADIHIGSMPYKDTFDAISYIKDMLKAYTKDGPLDFIIIGGDYFDKQLYANDPFIKLAQKLMIYIIISARVIRIVNGTSSHDCNQYGLFDTLEEDIPLLSKIPYDFKVITTVSEEELLPGLHVLYVPEEYVFDKEEYYKDYLSEDKHYDYIFGHGVIKEAFPYIKHSKTVEKNRRRAPEFEAGELFDRVRGHVIFGHYHIHSEYYDDKVSYSGSLFRWKQGEEEDKGFYYLEASPEEENYYKLFVVNDTANKYITKYYGYNDKIFDPGADLELEAKRVIKLKKNKNIYQLRLVFNIPLAYENPEGFINFWRERFKSDEFRKSIRVEYGNGYTDTKEKRKEELSADLTEDEKIILDKNIPEVDKIAYFLKRFKGIDMSISKIEKYLKTE